MSKEKLAQETLNMRKREYKKESLNSTKKLMA